MYVALGEKGEGATFVCVCCDKSIPAMNCLKGRGGPRSKKLEITGNQGQPSGSTFWLGFEVPGQHGYLWGPGPFLGQFKAKKWPAKRKPIIYGIIGIFKDFLSHNITQPNIHIFLSFERQLSFLLANTIIHK